jgi:hypothetical protein
METRYAVGIPNVDSEVVAVTNWYFSINLILMFLIYRRYMFMSSYLKTLHIQDKIFSKSLL